MTLLVENVWKKLGLVSLLEHTPIDDTPPREKLDVRPIPGAVSAELGEYEVVDLEGPKPKVLEASGGQIDKPGGVALRILRDRHAMKPETVLPRHLATFAGDDGRRSSWTWPVPRGTSPTLMSPPAAEAGPDFG